MSAEYKSQKNDSQIELSYKKKEDSGKSLLKRHIIVGVLICVIALAVTFAIVFTLKKDETSKEDHITDRDFTLLISLDGFRAEYLQRGITPNLQQIANNGVKADYMIPSFPTKTFTNHYTIATGLYPESNGIVANNFYDPELKDSFKIGPKAGQSKWWYGEPIWVTAIKNGLKAASYYFVGSEAAIQGIRPTYWRKYDSSVQWIDRINQVINWMKLPIDQRPTMITMYFEEPDLVGHREGPINNVKIENMIKLVDETIGKLLKKLEDNDLKDKVNMIIVSDHGMTSVDCYQNITLVDKIDVKEIHYNGLGAVSLLNVKNQSGIQSIYDDLRCSSEHLNVYTKHNNYTPKRYHYTNNKRIGDIVLSPKMPWSVIVRNGRCYPGKGGHGYDNLEVDMRAIFVASGPAFKKNYKFEQLSNIEIYSLITDLLHIPAAPNNGTYGSLHHVLNKNFTKILKRNTDEKLYNFVPRYFPDDYRKALNECNYCTCSNCNRNVSSNMDYYRKNLNLSLTEVSTSHKTHAPWGLPKSTSKTSNLILTQKSYVIGYDTQLHLPLWVTYKLTSKQVNISLPRWNCFRKDIRLTDDESSFCYSYYKSGFDRGHMAPSDDFDFTFESDQDTFVLSNIAPQYPYFNRHGIWRYLEEYTRDQVRKYGTVYIYSGSIFDVDGDGIKDADDMEKSWTKGKGSVGIPTHYYKILLRCLDGDVLISQCDNLKTIVFIVPHTNDRMCEVKMTSMEIFVKKHVARIRDVEILTDMQFLPNMPFEKRVVLVTKIYDEF